LRREMLAGLCWPQASEANARRYLRQALWRIRRALGPDKVPGPACIYSDDIQVGFNSEAEYWLDTEELESRREGWDSIEALMESASHFQGDLLPGFYDDWVSLERERLHSIFEQKTETLLSALLQEERWRDAVEWAEFWIARSGAPEPAFRGLMRAHRGLGDRSGIGAAYRRCVEALKGQLGVAPDGETTAMYRDLIGAGEAIPSLEAEPEPAFLGRDMAGVPIPVSALIDRVDELARIDELLSGGECRLLTLTGLGGTGKTRLAIEAGMRRAGALSRGVIFLPAADLPSPELFAASLARALGASLFGQRGYAEQMAEILGDRELLIILDGFEQVMDAAPLVGELLLRSPGVKLLVTSRERLDLQGEWVLEVRGLAVPEASNRQMVEQSPAAQMFLHVARHLDPDFDLGESDIQPVARLCAMTEGLPLAIEIAASWTRLLACQAIVDQVGESLGFLATSRRDLPPRQRSVLATFDHSWKGLSESERKVFRRLAVFRGGFDRRSATCVTGATLEQLSALVDKSLVMRLAGDRLTLHALVAEYVQAKLEEAGETEELSKRHRDRYLEIAVAHEPRLWGSGHAAHLDRLEAERDNLRAALQWSIDHGDVESRLRLACSLAWFWYVRGYYEEGRHWLEQVLMDCEGASPMQLSRTLYQCSLIASQQGDHERAGELSIRALSLLEGTDSLWDQGWALAALGYAAQERDEHRLAFACFSTAEELFREENYLDGALTMMLYKGIACGRAGDGNTAQALVQESLQGLGELKDTVAIARGLHFLAELSLHRADFTQAAHLLGDALRNAQEKNSRHEIGQCLEGMAALLIETGEPTAAGRLLGAADRIRKYLGSPGPAQTRQWIEGLAARAAAELPPGALAQARQEGMSLAPEQAIALALQHAPASS
jgi:predicted ATPase/DNA-binding SARP family transcriptional activator